MPPRSAPSSTRHDGHDFTRADSPEARAILWQARHDALPRGAGPATGIAGWTTDACVPISRLADCIRETKADLADSRLIGPLIGHVGDGNFHLVIPVYPTHQKTWRKPSGSTDRLVERTLAMDGTCTGEHGVGLGKMSSWKRSTAGKRST